mgnify:CR=1 FL=1
MAKRKKTKRSTVRRRRVGGAGMNLDPLMFAAIGAVAGKFVGKFLASQTLSSNTKTDAMIKQAIPVVGGVALSMTLGKKDSKMNYLGLGMAASGAANLIGTLVPSIGAIDFTPRIAAISQRNYLNGAGTPRAPKIAGSKAFAVSMM